MFLALAHKRRVAIQGQPGTGKTRLLIALMAQNASYWQQLRREEADAAEEAAREAMTGHPQAIASIGGKPKPSYLDGKARQSAPWYSALIVASET